MFIAKNFKFMATSFLASFCVIFFNVCSIYLATKKAMWTFAFLCLLGRREKMRVFCSLAPLARTRTQQSIVCWLFLAKSQSIQSSVSDYRTIDCITTVAVLFFARSVAHSRRSSDLVLVRPCPFRTNNDDLLLLFFLAKENALIWHTRARTHQFFGCCCCCCFFAVVGGAVQYIGNI